MINLYTTYYYEENSQRNEELNKCLINNKRCQAISNIYVISEIEEDDFIIKNKINIKKINKRPTFDDFFNIINRTTSKDEINIIANGDIYFDETLNRINEINLHNYCLALTRWDVWDDRRKRLTEISGSQDSWIFKGKIKKVIGDFPIGVPGCDNRIAYEINKSGYIVINPSISIKSYHLHKSRHRPNIDKWFTKGNYIDKPHLYIMPVTLESIYNFKFFSLFKNKKRFSDYLYERKIYRWYQYKEHSKNNNTRLINIRSVIHVLYSAYYRIPFEKLLLLMFFRKYYNDYIKR